MGLRLFGSNSSYDPPTKKYRYVDGPPNPDPSNYIIKRHLQTSKYLLIEITYPDCTNYEGNKILLYKNATLQQLKDQVYIDPHFSKNITLRSPIARFEPTQNGWNMAKTILYRKDDSCLKKILK